jgi:hypothetical protein
MRGIVSHRSDPCAGQALIESCLIVCLTCLILFAVFQLSQLYAAKEILDHAATAGERARTVGFNDFMVYKVTRVAAIPNAGKMLEPADYDTTPAPGAWGAGHVGEMWNLALTAQPASPQYAAESARIPLYLGAEDAGWLPGVLQYADWDTISSYTLEWSGTDQVSVRTHQDVPLRYPFHRTFYAADEISMEGNRRGLTMEDHYPLYLQ